MVDAPLGDGENAIGATPPGVDWPTHGGYLGCLIGCLAAFLIGGFLGSVLLGTLYVVGGGTALAMAVVAIVVYAGVAYGLCRLGWSLGKRYYRSYQDLGSPTWGEHDEYKYPDQERDDAAETPETDETEDGARTDVTSSASSASDALAHEDEDDQTELPLSRDGRRAR